MFKGDDFAAGPTFVPSCNGLLPRLRCCLSRLALTSNPGVA
jgi:hypothetical protein